MPSIEGESPCAGGALCDKGYALSLAELVCTNR